MDVRDLKEFAFCVERCHAAGQPIERSIKHARTRA